MSTTYKITEEEVVDVMACVESEEQRTLHVQEFAVAGSKIKFIHYV